MMKQKQTHQRLALCTVFIPAFVAAVAMASVCAAQQNAGRVARIGGFDVSGPQPSVCDGGAFAFVSDVSGT